MADRTLTVRVASKTPLTPEVTAFELVHPWGRTLPGFQAGAHIDVHLPGGFTRQYSLAFVDTPEAGGDGASDCRRYVIGVKREPQGRGGSAALHDRVNVGDLLPVSSPRNNFPLQAQARHHLLLAGGIGLTPLLAMAQQCRHEGRPFTLCVFARSRQHLPFADDLAALAADVRLHFDEPSTGPLSQRLDLVELLRHHAPGTHLYLCGPAGFMRAVQTAAAHWPEGHVHLEYFAPPESATGAAGAGRDEPFTLVVAGRGIEVPVAADQTAIDALHDIGIDVPTSCAQGVCGTCVVALAAPSAAGPADTPGNTAPGDLPDHRDHCLTATERRSKVALCCSRAKAGGRLVITLP